MPSFESLILAPPAGFGVGCRALNSLLTENPTKFTEVCRSAITAVRTGATDLHLKSDETNVINAHRTIGFLARSWVASSIPGAKDVAVALDSHTSLSRGVGLDVLYSPSHHYIQFGF